MCPNSTQFACVWPICWDGKELRSNNNSTWGWCAAIPAQGQPESGTLQVHILWDYSGYYPLGLFRSLSSETIQVAILWSYSLELFRSLSSGTIQVTILWDYSGYYPLGLFRLLSSGTIQVAILWDYSGYYPLGLFK